MRVFGLSARREWIQSDKAMSILITLFLFCLFLIGCAAISPYSPVAYEYATTLKVDTMVLMDLATEPYSDHQSEISSLVIKLNQAYEYANGRPKNEISTTQWEILKDPEGNLVGGFLERWKEKSTLSSAYIQEKKQQIAAAFDTIIGLESKKIKPNEL